MTQFVHLHVHTQYSILDGEAKIKPLLAKAKEYGMNSLAITDHGNMYGVLEFFEQAKKAGIKPLLGCEMYVAKGSRFEKNGKDFSGHHLILIAKNQTGYQNLILQYFSCQQNCPVPLTFSLKSQVFSSYYVNLVTKCFFKGPT